MAPQRQDPVAARSDDSEDLYEISDWEVRSTLDRVVYWLYYGSLSLLRLTVVLAAFAILFAQFVLGGLGTLADPVLGAFTVLSAFPALGLAAYIWDADVTSQEPLSLIVATFVLGVLFASFAGILNDGIGTPIQSIFSLGGAVPFLGSIVFFYVVVGPVEESVKLLAVRLFAFRSDRFDAVVDGAVYGAIAGLGFATIENGLYITQNAEAGLNMAKAINDAGGIAIVRTLAGPGHVIYSAFSGYYLGLAKFNSEHAGPIILKGLVIASLVHATYNTLVGIVPGIVAALTGVSAMAAFFGFIIVYDGVFGLILVRKIKAYERAYKSAGRSGVPYESERTEFES